MSEWGQKSISATREDLKPKRERPTIQILGDVSFPRVVINNSLPKPTPRNDELLIKVHAAGITGDESRIPGHEISGTISATGPDYHGPLQAGQEVAPKSSSLSHEEAAALPIPFLTAWEALVDHGALKPGMRVLITGASGAVGSVAVQLATHLSGCHITALASCRHHGTLRRLGAQEVLDYNSIGWEHHVHDIDIVFDTVGGQVMTKTWGAVRNDGLIVTVADPPPPWAFGRGVAAESLNFPAVRYKYFVVSPSSERLAKLSGMISECVITALAVRSFPAGEAEQAWAQARQRNHGSKVVVTFG
ncbi:hypothetical protein KVR01_007740 [Diaporthe batatas]|uniref:uncharacterized protein n=1 Tax=Diaporthe batatas TaxID=748121 RepID=UPI001D0420E4|nr:uncharacterized protein KVR01_007740 [Diaporthe batatas]KAG8161975.1 hypothetical protein KVR01_007740 [Diaporthe batatas]